MKVPFIFGPGDVRMQDVVRPAPGASDVVLQVGSVGICGSDLAFVAAGGPAGPSATPVPLGHELSGTVIEAGDDVRAFAVGDRVIVNPLVNLIGNGGPEGGFGEWLLVRDIVARPESLLRLPAHISLETGALVEPLAVGVHAVNRLGASRGDKVAIVGAGPIGLAAIVALRQRGIDNIVIFELSAFRRDRALRLGARHAVDPRETPIIEALAALHGTTAIFSGTGPQTSHYLEASGAPVLGDIIAGARRGATICVTSLHKKPATIDLQAVMAKEITITGALGYPSELPEVIEMLASTPIDLEPMISHRFAGDDFLDAFAAAQQSDRSAKVIVHYAG